MRLLRFSRNDNLLLPRRDYHIIELSHDLDVLPLPLLGERRVERAQFKGRNHVLVERGIACRPYYLEIRYRAVLVYPEEHAERPLPAVSRGCGRVVPVDV